MKPMSRVGDRGGIIYTLNLYRLLGDKSMPISEVLTRTIAKIESDGWAGQERGSEKARCLVMSLQEVNIWGSFAAEDSVARYLGIKTGTELYAWNDAPGRTQEEVLLVLRTVATIERAREGRLLPVLFAQQETVAA